MIVIGILGAIAVVIFIFARSVGGATQAAVLAEDSKVQAEITSRIKPVGHVLEMGGAELAAAAAAAAAPVGAATAPLTGPQVYNAACIACHAAPGVGGAP